LFNPFLFISSFSWPCCVQTLFSINCLKVPISEFQYNLLLVSYGDNEIKKSKKLCIGQEIRPQTALISLRFVQNAADNSDRRSRQAHQPVKEIYRRFAPLFEFWATWQNVSPPVPPSPFLARLQPPNPHAANRKNCIMARPAMSLCAWQQYSPDRAVLLPVRSYSCNPSLLGEGGGWGGWAHYVVRGGT
jgi:hypothetical protein